jgi:hypothetical protein
MAADAATFGVSALLLLRLDPHTIRHSGGTVVADAAA